jgi:hypothetical protein
MDFFAALPAEIIAHVAERLVLSHAQRTGDSLILLVAASPAVFRTLYKEREWRHELRGFICTAPSVESAVKDRVAAPRDWEFGQTVNLALHDACCSCGARGARARVSLRARVCGLCVEWFLCPEDEAALVVEGGVPALRRRVASGALWCMRRKNNARHYLYSQLRAVPEVADPWQDACGACGNLGCTCGGANT